MKNWVNSQKIKSFETAQLYFCFNKYWIIFDQPKSLQHIYFKKKHFEYTQFSLHIFIVFV